MGSGTHAVSVHAVDITVYVWAPLDDQEKKKKKGGFIYILLVFDRHEQEREKET